MAGQTAAEIINHHMTNLSIGEGFYSLHIDTLFFSILLGRPLLLVDAQNGVFAFPATR